MDKASELCLQALDFYLSELSIQPQKVLIIHAPPGDYLNYIPESKLTVVTHNAHHSKLWEARPQIEINPDSHENYDLILHISTKFQGETKAYLGIYSQNLAEEGLWITTVQNRLGASHSKKQIQQIFGNLTGISKSKCRVLVAEKNNDYQKSLANGWAQLHQFTPIQGTDSVTIPGIFSADKIDSGSLLLCEYLEKQSWHGTGADFGAGYGYLSQQILKTRHRIRELHLYELDQRALHAAKLNLKDTPCAHYHWSDITQGIHSPRPFHWILMNPPFHTGGDTDIELGLTFIHKAHQHLKDGGKLYIVANLHLPYEALLHNLFRMVKPIGERDGFKCFEATK